MKELGDTVTTGNLKIYNLKLQVKKKKTVQERKCNYKPCHSFKVHSYCHNNVNTIYEFLTLTSTDRKRTNVFIDKDKDVNLTNIDNKGASLVAQMVKSLPAMQETQFDPWVRKIPWRREWQPTPVFLPGKSHGRSCLAGYSPWIHRVGHA